MKHSSRAVWRWAGLVASLALVAVAAAAGTIGWVAVSPALIGVALGACLAVLWWQEHRDASEAALVVDGLEELVANFERNIARQTEMVDALADGLDVGILLCDAQGTIEFANRRAAELFGFDEPMGRTIIAVSMSTPLENLAREAAKRQKPSTAEVVLQHPEERICMVRCWPDSTAPGRVFMSIYDITDLRHLERVRRDFVGNVSHELRTPLTKIRALSESMLEDDDPNLRKRYLGQVMGEVDRLANLTRDLLILSAAESVPVERQPCDLSDIARETVAGYVEKAAEKGLRLTFESSGPGWIEGSENQISQVVTNLLENALNHTVQGEVNVRVKADAESVVLEVADTGIGIASEHQARIFERFYRVDKSRSRETGGTGLGLSIVKHLVEAHGGRATVESALNHGSTFRATFPRMKESAA